MVFEISLSENFSLLPTTLTTTTRSYPQLCDVSALALLSPKTSRFVGLTTYRCRVRFRGPSTEVHNMHMGILVGKSRHRTELFGPWPCNTQSYQDAHHNKDKLSVPTLNINLTSLTHGAHSLLHELGTAGLIL